MKRIILSILVLSAFVSCKKNKSQSSSVEEAESLTAVSFTATTSTGTTWDAGDEIGAFMYESGGDLYDDGSNVCYYISSGAATSSAKFSADDPLYFPLDTDVDFVAYSPYTKLSSTTISINTSDQSSEAKMKALDLMVARATGCNDATSPTLSFSRKMSKVIFNVSRKESAEGKVLGDFTLSGVVSDGTYTILNASTTSVAAGTTKSDISLFMDDSEQVEAILTPQSATAATISVSIDGLTYSDTVAETFEAGNEYSYTLYVGQDEVEISEVTIKPWGDEVDGGELELTECIYTASEIDADNVPRSSTWTITDEGEMTEELMAGVRAALDVAKDDGRSIKIIFPNATSIGDYAFDFRDDDQGNYSKEISALTDIEMPNVTAIGNNAFYYCGFTSFDFEGITTIGTAAFSNCVNLTEVINFNYATISTELFFGCGFTSFDFEGITEVGDSAFSNCANLTEVINFNYTTIPYCLFTHCGFTSFDFAGVEVIEFGAFANCYYLTDIELPATVSSIGDWAFLYNKSLSTVTLNWIDSEILTYDSDWFEETPLERVYIPAGTMADYVTKGWSESLLIERD